MCVYCRRCHIQSYRFLHISNVVKLAPLTFATLPASPIVGTIAHISDSDTIVWGDVPTGGGGNTALLFYNGSNWTVIGK